MGKTPERSEWHAGVCVTWVCDKYGHILSLLGFPTLGGKHQPQDLRENSLDMTTYQDCLIELSPAFRVPMHYGF